MQKKKIKKIAFVLGNKDLIEYFVEQFNIDGQHDGAEIKAILAEWDSKGKRKAFDEVSQFIYDGSMDTKRKFHCQESVNYLYNDFFDSKPKTSPLKR